MKLHRPFIACALLVGCADGVVTDVPSNVKVDLVPGRIATISEVVSCRVARKVEGGYEQKTFELTLPNTPASTSDRESVGIREWTARESEPERVALCDMAEPSLEKITALKARLGF